MKSVTMCDKDSEVSEDIVRRTLARTGGGEMDERKGQIEKGGVSEVGGDGLHVPLHVGSTGWSSH